MKNRPLKNQGEGLKALKQTVRLFIVLFIYQWQGSL